MFERVASIYTNWFHRESFYNVVIHLFDASQIEWYNHNPIQEEDEDASAEKEDKGAEEAAEEQEDIDTPVEEEDDDDTLAAQNNNNETTSPDSDPAETVGAFRIPLESFSIGIDYHQVIEEDPGIQDYLLTEMKQTLANLYKIELAFSSGATPAEAQQANANRDGGRRRRRRLVQQYLYYTGTAYFEGGPSLEPETVVDLQTALLSDADAVRAVILASLGGATDDTNNDLAVSSIVMNEPAIVVAAGTTGNADQTTDAEDRDDSGDGELSTTGLVIVIVAAVVGGIACMIVFLGGILGHPRISNTQSEEGYVLDAATKDGDAPTVDLHQAEQHE